jgi:hypothetical protein
MDMTHERWHLHMMLGIPLVPSPKAEKCQLFAPIYHAHVWLIRRVLGSFFFFFLK